MRGENIWRVIMGIIGFAVLIIQTANGDIAAGYALLALVSVLNWTLVLTDKD